MKTVILCRIQVPTSRGDLKNHGSFVFIFIDKTRIIMLFSDWNFHTLKNFSSYMAVPFLDAVTDFCDDTEEHFHDQGTFLLL